MSCGYGSRPSPGRHLLLPRHDGQITSESRQSPQSKIFCFTEFANQCITPGSPRLQEGTLALVTERWRGLRWPLWRQVISPDETFAADGEVVRSWRRDRGVKFLRS